MGSAGAVVFCGDEHRYQLIVSRRCESAGHTEDKWGFTVVRRRPPQGMERNSVYQYLAPSGEILSLTAEELPLWTRGANPQGMRSGTLVRLYEYKLPAGGSSAKIDFAAMLNRRLYRLPLPIQVVERRYGREGPVTVSGMETLLAEPDTEIVEEDWPQGGEVIVRDVGKVTISLVPLKEEAERRLAASEAIIFTINGQAHAFSPRDFLRSPAQGRPNLPWLAKSLLVEVDCSNFSPKVVEDLFMSSRDRMKEGPQRQQLLQEVGSYLRSHTGLRELNDRRKQAEEKRAAADDPYTERLFGQLSSEITRYIQGNIGHRRGGTSEREPFRGNRFPTFLHWTNRGIGEQQEQRCPENGSCTLNLRTDAENDFLIRPDSAGELQIEPQGWFVSQALTDGELKIRMRPPEGLMAVGDSIPLAVRLVSEDSLIPELVAYGTLVMDPPAGPSTGSNGGGRKSKGNQGTPKIVPVRKGDLSWETFEFL